MAALQSGSFVGSYEILAPIGAGGMGEVYHARDTKLKRDVAIKVLSAEFSREPERVARAQREAEILAAMNHPNIAQIYGQEECGTSHCLVLEFVDGETLQKRLRGGPIPLEEALEIARQIAAALGAAHERGIVHRDLKPGNIMITSSGQVKVLDFGLAKAVASGPGDDFSKSPTLVSNPTAAGVILGTAAYMSPEQVNGKTADARSDVWAFGVVLYEMLTGKSAFGGESMLEVLGSVLKTDPVWTALPATTPPIIQSLLRRCLQKDRSRRLRDIADARFQIEEASSEPVGVSLERRPVRKERNWKLWLLALSTSTIAGVLLTAFYVQHAATESPETKLQIITPPANNPADFAISPDGNNVVFQATVAGMTQLWLRPLDSEDAQPIPETLGATHPFWSADSRSIGFFADQRLKRKDIGGGAAETLAEASTETFGGTWNADGDIVFAPTNTSPLYRVKDRAGPSTEATHVGPTQGSHRLPVFLPDGRHFLFYATGETESRGVYLGSLDSTQTRRLVESDSAAVFAPPNYVLFVRQETLFGQRLDLGKLELVGDRFSLKEQVAIGITNQIATIALSASKAGPIAYRKAGTVRHQLTWVDRTGKPTGTLGEPDAHQGSLGLSLSTTDEVALSRVVAGNLDLFLMDKRGVLQPFTSDAAPDGGGVWSPDATRIAFNTYRKGLNDIYLKSITGGNEKPLIVSKENKLVHDWSPDGRFLLYSIQNPKSARDLWAFPMEEGKNSFVVVNTPFEDLNGSFSPNSDWIAYQSNKTRENEIYIQPFPDPGQPIQISIRGGTHPLWRGDTVFFLSPDNRMMAVHITRHANSLAVEASAPDVLFRVASTVYDISRDGQRFLFDTPLEEASASAITVIQNWAVRKN